MNKILDEIYHQLYDFEKLYMKKPTTIEVSREIYYRLQEHCSKSPTLYWNIIYNRLEVFGIPVYPIDCTNDDFIGVK